MKYQKGYFAPRMGKSDALIVGAVLGFSGWAAIELLIWLFSFIQISINA